MTAQKFNFSAAFDCVHSACTNEFNDVHQMAYTVHNSDCDAQIVQFSSFWHGNIEPNLWGQMRRSFRANKWAQSCPCDWVDRQRSRFSFFFSTWMSRTWVLAGYCSPSLNFDTDFATPLLVESLQKLMEFVNGNAINQT